MQFSVIVAAILGATFAAAAPASEGITLDCDCLRVCNSNNFDADNCYNTNIGCGTFQAPTCCGWCGCNCP